MCHVVILRSFVGADIFDICLEQQQLGIWGRCLSDSAWGFTSITLLDDGPDFRVPLCCVSGSLVVHGSDETTWKYTLVWNKPMEHDTYSYIGPVEHGHFP